MNSEFPPLVLPAPQVMVRRKEKPRYVPLPQEILVRRQEIARRLEEQITPLSENLRQLSDEERRTVFYKIEHEGIPSLVGTKLKPIAEPTATITLAIPRSDNLDDLIGKINEFGTGQEKLGHVPNERLVVALKTIAVGDPKDRLSQALYEQYDKIINQDWIVCEIEILSLANGSNQQRKELEQIRGSLESAFANGTRGNFFEHEDIRGTCRAVIRCTGSLFRDLVEGREWQTRISWFDARPEFETFHSILRDFSFQDLGPIQIPSDHAPVVCVVDTGVTSGNPFLQPVTKPELLKSFLKHSPENPYDEFGHGSGVASLVSYYALNLDRGASNVPKVWIASARVLDENNEGEEDRLFSLVLSEVVDFFVPLGVRVFNLSVNIKNRKWNAEAKRTVPRRSWIARSIDRLSREHDIVFVVSTGNIPPDHVRAYLEQGSAYPDYLHGAEASILDPGQAALALTVGAISPGTLVVGRVGEVTAIAQESQPAPFTRSGPGISREVKPEVVDYGGNYVQYNGSSIVSTNPGTDVMMASHQLTPALIHNSGTSFAAPRVAHKLALVLADLQSLGMNAISAPLLKAFLVNSTQTTRSGEFMKWLYVVGYGFPDADAATYCGPYSAILCFQGTLQPDSVAYFDIPVPAILSTADNGTKRLTVTVAHAPEVQRWGLERYLGTTLKWRLFRGDVTKDAIIRYMSAEDDEDETNGQQIDRPGELKGALGITIRSRGTIQHDVFEWTRHQDDYSADTYTLAVAAYEKWGRNNPEPVPYAVVVRIEETTQTAEIYSAIQNILARIETRVRV